MVKELFLDNIMLGYHYASYAKTVCIKLLINVGSTHDNEKRGISHFLEHMLIEPFKSNNEFRKKYRLLGTTSFEYTSYEIECYNNLDNITNAFVILKNIISGQYLSYNTLESVRKDINNEFDFLMKKIVLQNLHAIFLEKGINLSPPIGTKNFISSITYDDIVLFHKNNYSYAPISIFVSGSIDLNIIKNIIEHIFNNFEKRDIWKIPETTITNNNILKKYLITNTSNDNLKLYIENFHINFSLYNRVLEDFALVIIENLIESYFKKTRNLQIQNKVTKIRLFGQYNYLSIEFRNLDTIYNSFFKSLYLFIEEELPKVLIDFLDEYINFIINSSQLKVCTLNDELKNHFLYHEPLYDNDKYIKYLSQLKINEVKDILYKWLYESETINIEVNSINYERGCYYE